ncbi:MAG: GC-type dockerin domain-anchored protein, partial [Planctomycetota bacterium]
GNVVDVSLGLGSRENFFAGQASFGYTGWEIDARAETTEHTGFTIGAGEPLTIESVGGYPQRFAVYREDGSLLVEEPDLVSPGSNARTASLPGGLPAGTYDIAIGNRVVADPGFFYATTSTGVGIADRSHQISINGEILNTVDTQLDPAGESDWYRFTVLPVACNAADLAAPLGILNSSDINAFVAAFLAEAPGGDLAGPEGIWNSSDLNAFVAAFLAGCPSARPERPARTRSPETQP